MLVRAVSLCVLVAAAVRGDEHGHGTKNTALVQKRRARSDAKEKFEETHLASFDEYGRVIRYGLNVDDVECEDSSGSWRCKVTLFSRRKYLTKEEKLLSQQIKFDKQSELDGNYGAEGPEAALKKARVARELRARCNDVFLPWLAKFTDDSSDGHEVFFRSLRTDYEDFGELMRLVQGGGSSGKDVKRAKKLKRHISLLCHEDKIPAACASGSMKTMLAEVLNRVDQLVDCVSTPHACVLRDEF